MNKIVFKKIEGLDGYEISNYGVMKSFKCSPHRILKLSKQNTYSMFENGKIRKIHVGRLIYAAFNGLNINELGNIHIIGTNLYNLQVFTNKEYLAYISSLRKSRKLSLSDVVADYKESIKFSNIVLRFIETQDATDLCNAVYSHKDELYQYALKKHFSYNDDTINEAVSWVMNECITRLTALETSRSNIRSYMRRIMRTYFCREQERKRRNGYYQDNKVYYGIDDFE